MRRVSQRRWHFTELPPRYDNSWTQKDMGALMDIERVFNYTSREDIFRALNRHQTPPSLIEWIAHMLTHQDLEAPTRAILQPEGQLTPDTHREEEDLSDLCCGVWYLTT